MDRYAKTDWPVFVGLVLIVGIFILGLSQVR